MTFREAVAAVRASGMPGAGDVLGVLYALHRTELDMQFLFSRMQPRPDQAPLLLESDHAEDCYEVGDAMQLRDARESEEMWPDGLVGGETL